jgi:hypothetical protein
MWFERFVIIVNGLHRDFLPSSWGSYSPSYVEVLTFVGSFGLFLTLFLLFCRWLPMVAMAEVKGVLGGGHGMSGEGERERGGAGEIAKEHPEDPSVARAAGLSPSPTPPLPLYGLLAEYRDAPALLAAANRVREAGCKRWDCFSPMPVHGLDRAMGIRPTILPWLVFAAGTTGGLVALVMQWYCNAPRAALAKLGGLAGNPLITSGKPYWSLPANIPIVFELSVLFAALMAFLGLWALVRLPRLSFPAFASRRFRRATDDGFFLVIEAADKQFELERTRDLLASTGCAALEEVRDE